MQKSVDWGDHTQMVDPIRMHSWIIDGSGRHSASVRMAREIQNQQMVSTVAAGAFNPPPQLPASYEAHASIVNSMPLFPSRSPTCSRRVYARRGELPAVEDLRRDVLPLSDVDEATAWQQVRAADARRDDRMHNRDN